MPVFGEPLYGAGDDNTDFFLATLVESLPPNYRPEENRDFIERLLTPSAEDLSRVNQTYDLLDTLVYPESAPEAWVDWMIGEWWGWKLLPENYPLARKRRLLSNLHRHYKRRYTPVGISELLLEFGVHSYVIDHRLYVGNYLTERGVTSPLNIWVRILYRDPWESALDNYIGNYVGSTYVYRTPQYITHDFIASLCEWERAAGVRMIVHFVTASSEKRIQVALYGQPSSLGILQPIVSEPHITELQNETPAFETEDEDFLLTTEEGGELRED